MHVRQFRQDLILYAICEIGVIWIAVEVFKRKHRDSLCYRMPDKFNFQTIQPVATASATSDPAESALAGLRHPFPERVMTPVRRA